MGFHTTQNTKSKMGLRGKLCFILHFLFSCPHLDFFVTSSISPKPKVLILCFTCFMDDFSVCTNCFCFQVKKTRTLKGKHCVKIKDKNPSIKSTRQMRTQIDTNQRKNESKQSTKKRKKPYANRIHGYEMMINDKMS